MQKKNYTIRLVLIMLCLFGLFLPVATCPARQITVESEGVGFGRDNDMATARDMAIHDGLLRAIEQAMGVKVDSRTIISRTLLIDDTLVSSSHGVVQSYKILAEGIDEHGLYRVRLRAVVDGSELSAGLRRAAGRKRIVLLTEKNGLSDDQARYLGAVTENFVKAGFSIRDEAATVKSLALLDKKQVRRLAGQQNCDLVLGFSLHADKPTCPVDNYCATRGRSRLILWSGKTGEALARTQVKNSRGFGNTLESALENCRQVTVEKLGSNLVEQLFHPPVRNLKLVVRRLPDFKAYRQLMARLAAMRWVREAKEDAVGYHPGKSVFLVKFAGNPDLLGRMLANMTDYLYLGRTDDRLTLEFTEKE